MLSPTDNEVYAVGLEPIPVSALQHVSFCPRQYALIHLEQVFQENASTLRGQAAHQRVDQVISRQERGIQVLRALPIFSDRLGLVGKADVVEVLADGACYPVEYKLGKRRAKKHDALQLAAQALCLEEMTGRSVPKGAIYHVVSHQRKEVLIDETLRADVLKAIETIRGIQAQGMLPPPVHDARCKDCSLMALCQPELLNRLSSVAQTVWRQTFQD